jgi:uncharacterized membrane protein YphA (DoxX/SURF4 family)
MFVACVVVSVIVALAFLAAGGAKLARVAQSLEIRDRLRIPTTRWTAIGVLEVLGAAGVLIGLAVPAVGIAAAVCLVLLMVGAVMAHARAGEIAQAVPAIALALLAVAIIGLRLGSA